MFIHTDIATPSTEKKSVRHLTTADDKTHQRRRRNCQMQRPKPKIKRTHEYFCFSWKNLILVFAAQTPRLERAESPDDRPTGNRSLDSAHWKANAAPHFNFARLCNRNPEIIKVVAMPLPDGTAFSHAPVLAWRDAYAGLFILFYVKEHSFIQREISRLSVANLDLTGE